ncbi:MAG: hypothetical protein LC808_31490, partial [Actinobacteria bacterium]|nr:hypothetical protein [Actinomycetota bacterium]
MAFRSDRIPQREALRVAGIVLSFGYLCGLVPGSLVAVVGALAVTTAGRSLLAARDEGAMTSVAFVVFASALGVASFRWGTMSLNDLRGIQAVLGSSLEVGPAPLAA